MIEIDRCLDDRLRFYDLTTCDLCHTLSDFIVRFEFIRPVRDRRTVQRHLDDDLEVVDMAGVRMRNNGR